MNPALNRYRLEVMNVSYHSPLMRALHHASYTFEKRLSHTADSQDQRHRMVPASRPLMSFVDTAEPDFVTPRLIAANPQATEAYTRAMRAAWDAKNRLLALGVPLEFAMYVLPNAKTLRMVESAVARADAQVADANLLQRTGRDLPASMDEPDAVRLLHPRSRFIGLPCVVPQHPTAPRCRGTHSADPVWRDFPRGAAALMSAPWR